MPKIDVEYYEKKDGTCGLRFPHGIEASKFLRLWKQGMRKVAAVEKKRKRKQKSAEHSRSR